LVIAEASDNLIGGPTPGARNVISGNLNVQILITGTDDKFPPASRNKIEGNYIGTNAAGTASITSADGIYMVHAINNFIGGTTPGAGNLISGNLTGLKITGCLDNQVLGNFIGTDDSGTSAISNVAGGIAIINSDRTQIGGPTAGARNVISGNVSNGIWLFDSLKTTGNKIQGNYIGTKADGIRPLGSAMLGIFINNLAVGNSIGGKARRGRFQRRRRHNNVFDYDCNVIHEIGSSDGGLRLICSQWRDAGMTATPTTMARRIIRICLKRESVWVVQI
jgi:titin